MDDLINSFKTSCNINEIKNTTEKVAVNFEITNDYINFSCNVIPSSPKYSPYKYWIKELEYTKELLFEKFEYNNLFKLVAKIVHDNELNNNNVKKRNTVIKFVPLIPLTEWNKTNEYIYIFTINNYIVKIGGTRNGLKARCASYLCGHHIPERGKSGDCSKTNGYIYNTFDYYLQCKCDIKMYAYEIPPIVVSVDILDEQIQVIAQVYHAYESKFITKYKLQSGHYPILCDNSDPNYK
mgnify:FL=1